MSKTKSSNYRRNNKVITTPYGQKIIRVTKSRKNHSVYQTLSVYRRMLSQEDCDMERTIRSLDKYLLHVD